MRDYGFYIILEKMHCNLDQFLISNSNMNVNKKILILLKIARGLESLHEKNIVHLDIKPPNILLSESGTMVKICDFGISKLKQSNETSFTTNLKLGTQGYQAPELFTNGDYGFHSDVYSFAFIIFRILFERTPYSFDEMNHYTFLLEVKKNKRPTWNKNEVKDKKSKQLISLMNECWENNKENRPEISFIVLTLESLLKNTNL
jgi:mitogen-activated protein kinase kinase kinase 7